MTYQSESKSDRLYKLNIFYHTTGIPLSFLTRDGDTIHRLPDQTYLRGAFKKGSSIEAQSLNAVRDIADWTCVSFEDIYLQHFMVVKSIDGIVLVGPVQITDVTFEKMNHILTTQEHTLEEHTALRQHFAESPRLNMTQFKYMKLLLQNLNTFTYDVSELPVLTESASVFSSPRILGDEETSPHHPFTMELEFLQALKKGERSALEQLIQFDKFPIPNLGNGDPVRSYKNVIISAVAVSIREVTDVVPDFMLLQRFSDQCINKVEQTSNLTELTSLFQSIFIDLLDIIESQKKEFYSTSVKRAITYIRAHISDQLTLEQIALHTGFNPRYFAGRFKSETGMTILSFITSERMQIAKQLLKNTREKLTDIAHNIGYNDQSHFTQVFKKSAGVTPKQYREGKEHISKE
ncbi:helix-turn-helix transcriptional regulator [Salipaludibacillus sp. HK11]|uniref:helix-turn-helix transcriptional regulator n=1 Tax=Salipaludibacillus sp. HK11 TaxID=3394320 RepID=UPI0039FDCF53